MDDIGSLFGMLVLGGLCAVVAKSRGRSPLAWFLLGMFCGCIPLIVVCLLPDLRSASRSERRKRPRRRPRSGSAERRALPGPVDRAPPPSGFDPTPHDDQPPLAPADVIALPPPPPPPTPPSGGPGARPTSSIDVTLQSWHYVEESTQHGPVEFDELRELWTYGRIGDDTLVWARGLADWVPIDEHPDLHDALRG